MLDFFYKQPRITALVILLILATGTVAFQMLPRQEDPTMVARWAVINTVVPGAKAERVESLVTEEIESKLQEMHEIKKIDSISRNGLSSVAVEFHDNINDVQPALTRLREKVDEAEVLLPPDAMKPVVDHDEDNAVQMIVAIEYTGEGETPYGIMKRLAKKLEDRFRALPGTKTIELHGQPEEEIRIDLNPLQLDALRISIPEISQALARSDTKIAAGLLRDARQDLLIEVSGEFKNLDDIRNVIIRQSPAGHTIRLKDLGEVTRGVKSPMVDKARINEHDAITLSVIVDSSYRLDHWAEKAQEMHADFSKDIQGDLNSRIIFDQNTYTSERFTNLITNFLLGVGLVFIVILVLMGWRSAILIGSSLPAVSLMTLFILWLVNIPIHQMSITGLIIALGLMIDNAIVVVDDVRHRLKSQAPAEAISNAIQHLLIPLGGSTLTTIITFPPIALMPGGAGDFVGSIAVGVIIAISCSLFFSLLILTALTGWMRFKDIPPSLLFWRGGLRIPVLDKLYENIILWSLRLPVITILLVLSIPVAGFLIFPQLKDQFFPPTERDQIHLQIKLNEQAAISETEATIAAMESWLKQQPEVKEGYWFMGRTAPRFYYNMAGGSAFKSSTAEAVLQLNQVLSPERIQDLQEKLDREFPNAMVIMRAFEQGPPITAPIEAEIYGPSLNPLSELGQEARSLLAKYPGVTHTDSSMSPPSPKLEARINSDEVYRAGLSPQQVADFLDAQLEGQLGGSLVEGSQSLPVRVRLDQATQANLNEIRDLSIEHQGKMIPLDNLVDFQLSSQLPEITRKNGRRVNIIRGYVQAGELPMEISTQFSEQLQKLDIPAGYEIKIGGDAEASNEAVGNMMSYAVILLIVLAAVLVITFRSFRMAALIGFVGMMSIGLSMLSLWAWDYPFGFMAVIGTMGLIGVAINDSIVVLAAIREKPQARAGDIHAIQGVVLKASRHVIATTITTIAGFIPLVMAGGNFWPPMAVALAGGIGGATLMALFMVPAAYRLLMCPRKPRQQDSEASLTAEVAMA